MSTLKDRLAFYRFKKDGEKEIRIISQRLLTFFQYKMLVLEIILTVLLIFMQLLIIDYI